MGEVKPLEFYMDRETLIKALERCDLGDSSMARVTQYPHKDMLPHLVKVHEVLDSNLVRPDLSAQTWLECVNFFKSKSKSKGSINDLYAETLRDEGKRRGVIE